MLFGWIHPFSFILILTVNPLKVRSCEIRSLRQHTYSYSSSLISSHIYWILFEMMCTPFSIYSHHFHLKNSFISYSRIISIFTHFTCLCAHRLLFFISVKKSNNNSTIREKNLCCWVRTKEKISFFPKLRENVRNCMNEKGIKRKRINMEQIEWKYPVAKCLHTRTVKSDTRNLICKSMSLFKFFLFYKVGTTIYVKKNICITFHHYFFCVLFN